MSVVAKGALVLQDPQSGTKISIPATDLDFQVVDATDRRMGEEIAHEAEVEVDIGGKPHTVTLTVHEYPEGCYNSHELDTGGLEVVQAPTLEVVLADGPED